MKSFFPNALTYTSMTLPIHGQLRACFTVYLAFALDTRIALPEGEEYLLQEEFPQSAVIAPQHAWAAIMQSLDEASFLDLGLPKLYGEWLMGGCASAPQGSQYKALPVHVQVGDMHRDFLVTGHAVDNGISIPDPQVFSSMPMLWKNAYGGAKYAENPVGKGMDKDEHGALPLPNIAAKDCSNHEAACPLGRSILANGFQGFNKWALFPQNMGTYDADWVANTWPGVPKDFDWSYYNLAQIPQRMARPIADMGGFKGTEQIYISNMHPQCQEISGHLPALRVRLFVEYENGQGDHANHISQWNETIPVADTVWLFPSQNVGLMLFHVTIPTVNERNSDILSFAAHLEDVHSTPAPVTECIQKAILLQEASEIGEEDPDGDDNIDDVESFAPVAISLGASLSDNVNQGSEADIQEMLVVANEELKGFELSPAKLGIVNEQLGKEFATLKQVKTKEEEIKDTESVWIGPQNAEEFKVALREGIDLTNYNMDGMDLSGLNLTDLKTPDLSFLMLDNVILTNALLGGAIMQKTQLSGAQCNGTDFSACDLSNANLSNTRLQNCRFDQSICTDTNFNESLAENTSFTHATCSHSVWEKSHVENCDFSHCDLSHSSWLDSHFYTQSMENVNLSFASFENCRLAESVFHGNLENITFDNCDLTQVNFQNATLIKARFYHSNISEANLKDANLTESNWWGMHGKSTRMPNAILQNATFEECTLLQLHAPCLRAQECKWISCDLTEAQLKHMNLFQGSLRDCMVAGADLSGASLYGADLYLMRPSPQTNLFNTDLTNTCLTRG